LTRTAWRLLVAGGCVYLLFLLISVPASRVTSRLAQQVEGLSLYAVTGTVLSGEAARIVIQGQGIGPVNWTLRPLALLLGRLEYRVESTDAAFKGNATIGLGLNGVLVVHDLEAELVPDPLINRFSPVPVESTGRFTLLIEILEYAAGFPQQLAGRLDWNDARILEPVNLSLGQVATVMSRGEDALVATITGTPGDMAMSGEITLTPAGRYDLNLLLTPGPAISPDIVDALGTFAQSRPGGSYLLTDTGQL